MVRILTVLATLTSLALLGSFGLGLMQLAQTSPTLSPSLSLSAHIIVGLVTAVLVLLVHCLVFTYFLGTGRWVREVAQAYALSAHETTQPARQFKRQAYPPMMTAMVLTIATVGTGAASHTDPESWVGLTHPIFSVLTLLTNGWAFYRQWHAVRDNQHLLDRIMSLVQARQAANLQTTNTPWVSS
ncbi:MAG: hypothetical protein NZM42_13250 [Gemmatales bacterium]|nr:hypothetical protein [Gemmatales bacterium]MDW8222306.1 hypothetical protein [Gemmatales bacterium]